MDYPKRGWPGARPLLSHTRFCAMSSDMLNVLPLNVKCERPSSVIPTTADFNAASSSEESDEMGVYWTSMLFLFGYLTI